MPTWILLFITFKYLYIVAERNTLLRVKPLGAVPLIVRDLFVLSLIVRRRRQAVMYEGESSFRRFNSSKTTPFVRPNPVRGAYSPPLPVSLAFSTLHCRAHASGVENDRSLLWLLNRTSGGTPLTNPLWSAFNRTPVSFVTSPVARARVPSCPNIEWRTPAGAATCSDGVPLFRRRGAYLETTLAVRFDVASAAVSLATSQLPVHRGTRRPVRQVPVEPRETVSTRVFVLQVLGTITGFSRVDARLSRPFTFAELTETTRFTQLKRPVATAGRATAARRRSKYVSQQCNSSLNEPVRHP